MSFKTTLKVWDGFPINRATTERAYQPKNEKRSNNELLLASSVLDKVNDS